MRFLPSCLPRAVLIFGVASLLTDVSAEMIYPLLPAFLLAAFGAGPAIVGAIEGFAETTASFLKIYSGRVSDRTGKRKQLIVGGYALSGLMRPLIGIATGWPAVFIFRLADRVGKGLRTSPRDAAIAGVVSPEHHGAAFGWHRSMDHLGAVIGPVIASVLLLAGVPIRTVFLLALIPGIAVVVILALGVPRDAPTIPSAAPPEPIVTASPRDPRFKHFLAVVLIATLGASTDAFLLLRLTKAGWSEGVVALLWSAHHVVKSVSSIAFGKWSDRVVARPLIVASWIFYAIAYLLFGILEGAVSLAVTFLAYGAYYGLAEPSEKKLVAELVPTRATGSGFGLYHGMVGLASLPASLLFGLLWEQFGPLVAFGSGAIFSLAAAGLFVMGPAWRVGASRSA